MLGRTIPLYTNVLFGYVAASRLHVDRSSIATLLIYVIGPVVVFFATISVHIDLALLSLPLFFYLSASLVALLVYFTTRRFWNDRTGNILAFTAGTGNTGYFGIPLAMVLLPKNLADVYVFSVLASFLYESSTGFYVTARGHFSTREVFHKLLRLPPLYTFIAGLLWNLSGLTMPPAVLEFSGYFKGAYGILGMMILGMGLTGLRGGENHLDWKFIFLSLFFKFLFWPIFIIGFILLDFYQFHFLRPDTYAVGILFSLVPMAGNTVTLAVLLKTNPEKASIAVWISTLISILYIPAMLVLTGLLPFPVTLRL